MPHVSPGPCRQERPQCRRPLPSRVPGRRWRLHCILATAIAASIILRRVRRHVCNGRQEPSLPVLRIEHGRHGGRRGWRQLGGHACMPRLPPGPRHCQRGRGHDPLPARISERRRRVRLCSSHVVLLELRLHVRLDGQGRCVLRLHGRRNGHVHRHSVLSCPVSVVLRVVSAISRHGDSCQWQVVVACEPKSLPSLFP